MQTAVDETNKYQRQNATSNIGKTAAWYDTTMEELYVFFDTTILMGLNQKNRIKDYWSTDKLITTPIFGELFTRDRYLSILRYLHFADNNTEEESKLRKIKPVMEYLRAKFERTVILWENVCIDESLHRSRKRNRQLPGDWNDRFSGTNTDENLPKEKP